MTAGAEGTRRLLRDCEAMGRMVEARRPSAQERLQATLGDDLTDLLLTSLKTQPRREQTVQSDSQAG